MEAGHRTPLLDLFRRGEVPQEARLLAARGVLAPRAPEQAALLCLLAGDADVAVRTAAEQTLARIPREALAAVLAQPEVPAEVRAFFAARGVVPVDTPAGSPETPLIETHGASEADAPDRAPLTDRIARLGVVDRLKLAMRGNREERALLIRDRNKMVATAVLSNPKLTDSEIESFAALPTVAEDVLRAIGTSRAWLKRYGVIRALARNPKTPIAISLHLLPRLLERDVKLVAMDRNLPEPVRAAARRLLTASQTAPR